MPSGVYPRKPKPPDPFKLAKGRTIKKMSYSTPYRESLVLYLDNGDQITFWGYTEREMFNQSWGAVGVTYEKKEQA